MQYKHDINPLTDTLVLKDVFTWDRISTDIDNDTVEEYRKLKDKCDSVILRIKFRKANKLTT